MKIAKERQILRDITDMQNQKRGTDVLIYKTEVGKDLWLPGGKGEGLNGKIGLKNSTTVYMIVNNKNLLYSTGISTQCSVMICIGKELRKKKQNQSQYVYEFNSSTF